MTEQCFLADKHKDPPLDCLTCPRGKLIPKELVLDIDSPQAAFWAGYRTGLMEFAMHIPDYDEKLCKYWKALELRSRCSIDRDVPYEHFVDAQNEFAQFCFARELGQIKPKP